MRLEALPSNQPEGREMSTEERYERFMHSATVTRL